MKNALETYAVESGFGETYCMNLLQDHAIVSDLCVTAAEVAPANCQNAVEFLKGELFQE